MVIITNVFFLRPYLSFGRPVKNKCSFLTTHRSRSHLSKLSWSEWIIPLNQHKKQTSRKPKLQRVKRVYISNHKLSSPTDLNMIGLLCFTSWCCFTASTTTYF